MREIVLNTIEKYHMADKEESLLCCLSGGADSVALLLCLKECGFNVRACHVNHQLRGEESLRDENFCADLCEKLGVELIIRRIDAKGYSEQNGLSVEEGARELRYKIFAECGCDKTATAHTLSDCVETAVFNFARGTGLAGIASIPPVRGKIIRPLIECSRADVEMFLKERGVGWVTDSTNLSDDYTRNRIRHGIVPRLKEINPSLEKTARGTFENLREDNALLTRLGDGLYESAFSGGGLDCKKIAEADPALSARAIKRFLGEKGAQCSRDTVLRVRELCINGGRLDLGRGLYAHAWKGKLYADGGAQTPETEIKAEIGKEYALFGKKISLEITDLLQENANVHKNITNFTADYGKINGEIVIRNRRAGDSVRFIGKGFTTSLKKLFQSDIPQSERGRTVILADGGGVIFTEGYGFAERVKADKDTKTVLYCKIS